MYFIESYDNIVGRQRPNPFGWSERLPATDSETNRRAFCVDRPRVTRPAPSHHPEGLPGRARRGRGGARASPPRGVVGGRHVGTLYPGVRQPNARRPGGDGAGVARATAPSTFRHRRRRHGLDDSASRSPSAMPSRSFKYLGRVPRAVPDTPSWKRVAVTISAPVVREPPLQLREG